LYISTAALGLVAAGHSGVALKLLAHMVEVLHLLRFVFQEGAFSWQLVLLVSVAVVVAAPLLLLVVEIVDLSQMLRTVLRDGSRAPSLLGLFEFVLPPLPAFAVPWQSHGLLVPVVLLVFLLKQYFLRPSCPETMRRILEVVRKRPVLFLSHRHRAYVEGSYSLL